MTSEDDGGFPTDYEIAKDAEKEPIKDVLEPWGIDNDDIELYGDYKAKLSHEGVNRLRDNAENKEGNLVLVTGMTPTPMGEGKTVTTVGLGQTLNHVGEDAMIAIREPSLGPVFGVKGGAAGGGENRRPTAAATASSTWWSVCLCSTGVRRRRRSWTIGAARRRPGTGRMDLVARARANVVVRTSASPSGGTYLALLCDPHRNVCSTGPGPLGLAGRPLPRVARRRPADAQHADANR